MKNLYVKPQLVKMEVAMEGAILTGSMPVAPGTIANPLQIQIKRAGNVIEASKAPVNAFDIIMENESSK